MCSVCHRVRVAAIMVIVSPQSNAHATTVTFIMQPKAFVYPIVPRDVSMVNALNQTNANAIRTMCLQIVHSTNANRSVNCRVRMPNALSPMFANVIMDLWWPTRQNRMNATVVNIV